MDRVGDNLDLDKFGQMNGDGNILQLRNYYEITLICMRQNYKMDNLWILQQSTICIPYARCGLNRIINFNFFLLLIRFKNL